MAMITRQSVPWWQQGPMLGIVAIFLVLGIALTIESGFLGARELSDTSAYDSAPVCTSSADVSGCRFEGRARIVRTYMDKQYAVVEVAFDQLGGMKASAGFDPNAPQAQTWRPETEVDGELWRGLLTAVDGVRTESNPDINQGTGITVMAWIAGAVTILLAVAFIWLWVLWRRAKRAQAIRLAAENAGHPGTTQQLPLTPEMSAFLQKEAALAAQPVQMALVVFGAVSVLPAIFSVAFAFRHILFTPLTLLFWGFFLALGTVVTFGVLHDLRQERRDLFGGVFNRATGSFALKLNQGKYGSSVQVVIGGRALSSETAPQLESIESLTGAVDYLPVSGDLLEVRDESGRVLWTKFGTSGQPVPAQSAAR